MLACQDVSGIISSSSSSSSFTAVGNHFWFLLISFQFIKVAPKGVWADQLICDRFTLEDYLGRTRTRTKVQEQISLLTVGRAELGSNQLQNPVVWARHSFFTPNKLVTWLHRAFSLFYLHKLTLRSLIKVLSIHGSSVWRLLMMFKLVDLLISNRLTFVRK